MLAEDEPRQDTGRSGWYNNNNHRPHPFWPRQEQFDYYEEGADWRTDEPRGTVYFEEIVQLEDRGRRLGR